MIKAVLFDLDGTLVKSLDDLANAVNFSLSKYGFPIHETEKYKIFAGDGIPKMIERALPPENRDAKTHKKVLQCFFERYAEHCSDTSVAYDGVKELVSALKEKGIKVAVVTNKEQSLAKKVVFDIYGDVFDIVCGTGEGIPKKPDPTSTLLVMQNLSVTPQECIFIGDSGVDVLTGRSSGAVSVGVLWGYREKQEFIDSNAEYIISAPYELLGIIKEKNER